MLAEPRCMLMSNSIGINCNCYVYETPGLLSDTNQSLMRFYFIFVFDSTQFHLFH